MFNIIAKYVIEKKNIAKTITFLKRKKLTGFQTYVRCVLRNVGQTATMKIVYSKRPKEDR